MQNDRTASVNHVLKHRLSWLRFWHVEAALVLSDVSLQFVPVFQLQEGSEAPHQAEDKETFKMLAAGQTSSLLSWDQTLQQIHRLTTIRKLSG